jgi:hypothetical protein
MFLRGNQLLIKNLYLVIEVPVLPRKLSGTGQTETVNRLKQAEGLVQGPPARKTKELLSLNRNQL